MSVSDWAYKCHTLTCSLFFIVLYAFVIIMVCGLKNGRNGSGDIEIVSVKYQSHFGVIEMFQWYIGIDLTLNMREKHYRKSSSSFGMFQSDQN
jgi:hypothetical protein